MKKQQSIPQPFSLSTNGQPGEVAVPKKIIHGNPVTTSWNQFTDAHEQFFCGIWHSTIGCWQVQYDENELCFLLKGKVILTDTGGNQRTFQAGQAFVIPAGFKGTWETIEATEKIYAIHLDAGNPIDHHQAKNKIR